MSQGKFDTDGGASGSAERSQSDGQAELDVPMDEKPIFSLSQVRITPPRTPEQIRRLMAEGRVAEMTPGLAGYEDDEN